MTLNFVSIRSKIGSVATLLFIPLASSTASGHVHGQKIDSRFFVKSVTALSDTRLLRATGIEILAEDAETGVGLARLTPQDQARVTAKAHEWGRCGGFEALPEESPNTPQLFNQLRVLHRRDLALSARRMAFRLQKSDLVAQSVSEVNENHLKEVVGWLSSFPTRYNRGKNPNDHVVALKERLEKMVAQAVYPIRIELIDHKATPQKTLRVHIEGKERPNETVVLGAHLDSINQSFGGGRGAPGADDNASGSSNLIEALRIMVSKPQPQRSVEFFWYAGEESGLLGSSEIARQYKAAGRDIIGVLQLDMTLHPGDGEFTLGSMTDFTSPWLRSYFRELNNIYIHAKIIDDKCGYGCSDHASWHRQGYPALMPFEASFKGTNKRIHTSQDVVNPESSFRHSAMFAKIAVAFATDLGNSKLRSP